MESSETMPESPKIPSLVAILAGGGAVAWMLYQNGFKMFEHWLFYPSLFVLGITSISLLPGVDFRFRRFAWTFCTWWSGLWTLVFFIAFAFPPISTYLVATLVETILEAGRIGPIAAGFLHLLIWACAKDVVKHLNAERQDSLG